VAARAKGLVVVALLIAWSVVALHGARDSLHATAAQRINTVPQRIVSLVPALTEMLFAIGAGPQVVGVSSYDAFPPEVKTLPRVGALLDPDTERILALRPDLVITYGSQSNAEAQFARAGIRTYSYRHGGIATILESLSELAALTGRRVDGERIARELRARFDAVRARVRGRPRPRTVIVFEHDPGTLRSMFVSGGIGFLHDMLEIAGGEDVFADVKRESVQPSMETLISRAPDVIVEIRANPPANVDTERRAWLPLTTVPAVKNGRVHFLAGEYLVVPGPRVAQGVEAFARALHPDAFR
jgi:iron complex transport system substrate-binding protein